MKLPELKNPLTNNVSLSPMSLIGNIGWVAALFFIVAIGQNFKNKISSRIPALDGNVDPLVNQPAMNTLPQKTFY